jgi:hypothetical protein
MIPVTGQLNLREQYRDTPQRMEAGVARNVNAENTVFYGSSAHLHVVGKLVQGSRDTCTSVLHGVSCYLDGCQSHTVGLLVFTSVA